MANFIITFRFKSDDDYQERYDSFVKAVHGSAAAHPWDETSSFFALESVKSDETAESLCKKLWLESEFDDSKDTMLVIDLWNQKSATRGPIEYEGLLYKGLGF